MRYRVSMSPTESGGFLSELPDFPGVFSGGRDREEALKMIYDAFLTVSASNIVDKELVPLPGKRPKVGEPFIDIPTMVVAKITIHNAMIEQGVSQVALAERLGTDPKAVRRLLDLDHNSHWPQVEAALSALGYRLDTEARKVA